MRAAPHWWSLWVLPSSLCFALSSLIAKHSAITHNVIELCLWRYITLCLGGFMILKVQHIPLRNTYLRVHFSRALWGSLSILLYFFSLKILPVTMAIALFHSSPIFILLLLLFRQQKKEYIPWLILVCIIFCGTFMTLQPNMTGTIISTLICLAGAFLSALSFTRVSLLGQLGEPIPRIIFFLGLFGTLITLVIGFADKLLFHQPLLQSTNLYETLLMCALALLSFFGQSCLFMALIRGHFIYSSSLLSTDILFSCLIGFFFLSTRYSAIEVTGFIIISIFSLAARFLIKRSTTLERQTSVVPPSAAEPTEKRSYSISS